MNRVLVLKGNVMKIRLIITSLMIAVATGLSACTVPSGAATDPRLSQRYNGTVCLRRLIKMIAIAPHPPATPSSGGMAVFNPQVSSIEQK